MPSKIEYVDETWNPVTGCTKISPGCTNCFAECMARRLAGRFGYPEAPHHFDVTLHPDRLDEPLRRKKPTRYLVCSMGDLFHEDVPFAFMHEVFARVIAADSHTFLILTKRPKRMASFLSCFEEVTKLYMASFRHIHLGVTVESQDEMWRVEELLKIPAAKHWVSIEPMLGPIDMKHILDGQPEARGGGVDYVSREMAMDAGDLGMEGMPIHEEVRWEQTVPPPDWVVLGGETGPGARPCHPDWVRKVRDDCVAAGVDYFFKGWGAWAPGSQVPKGDAKDNLFLSTDGQIIPADTKPAPGAFGKRLWRFGKKAAGRVLDGRTWDEMPE